MISAIPQLNLSVQNSQPASQVQSGSAQKTDNFRSMLKTAQKTEAKTGGSSGKTEDVSENTGKAEKDGENSADDKAASAAAQNISQPVPVDAQPVQTNVPVAVQTAVPPISMNEGKTENPVELAAVQQVSTQQTVSQAAALQTATQQTVASQTAASQETVPQTAKEQAPAQVLPAQTDGSQKVQEIPQPKQQSTNAFTDAPQKTVSAVTTEAAVEAPTQTQPFSIPESAVASTEESQQSDSQTQVFAADAKTETLPQKEPAQSDPHVLPGTQQLSDLYAGSKVVVKVSDAPTQTKAPVSSQISNAVTDGLKAGKQQLQVDLYPESLGKVSVRLASENGVLTVEILAANPKTQSLLASSSGEIRSILHDSTGQTVQVSQQSTQQQYAGQNGNFSQQESARQQQQEEEARKYQAAQWFAANNSSGFSTGDFLTALQGAAT